MTSIAVQSPHASPGEWLEFVRELRTTLALLNVDERLEVIDSLPPDVALRLRYEYRFGARRKQLEPPGEDWRVWFINAGRGFGKTWTGANWVVDKVRYGGYRRVALVAETAADAREVMVEGPSGIMSVAPPDFRPEYEPSKRRLTFPNGAVATTYAADKPDQLRGPNHDLAWVDELAKFRYDQETWDQLQFTMRLGARPLTLVTTTPRPTKLIRELVKDPETVVTTGSTYENADNLARAFLTAVEKRYAGTRLGRQELEAEILEDVEGALWTLSQIEDLRCRPDDLPPLKRVVVAVDPSGTSTGDECGIVVVGEGHDGLGYVLADYSLQASPNEWAARVIGAYHDHEADRVVAETNFGADLVETTLRSIDRSVSFRKVTASRGKLVRAEPVAALYEQKRVRHVGAWAALETEMTSWVPGEPSPNRMDALVWGLTELFLSRKPALAGDAFMF